MKDIAFFFLIKIISKNTPPPVYLITREISLNTYTENFQILPSVAGLSDGGLVVCWESFGQLNNGSEIYSNLYDSNGVSITGEFKVNT